MPLNDKQLTILDHLREQEKPLSMAELLELLGPDFKARTVRRWLVEMEAFGLVERLGQKRGTRYQVREPAVKSELVDQPPSRISHVFSPESEGALALVRRPIFERSPRPYVEQWLGSYQPGVTAYLSPSLCEQLYKAGSRAKVSDQAGTYARRIYNRLLIDLSYNSSRLEGNTFSLLETERLILEGKSGEGKLDEERVMILNHKEAIRHLVDNAPHNLSITPTEICVLHYLLSDGLVSPDYSGKYRDHGVRIGGSTYIPYENPQKIKTLMNEICAKASKIPNPFEQSFFLLAHIAYLQAFVDVNKRTARLSANIPLVVHNLVPLSFNGVEIKDYTDAMIAIYELNDVGPLRELYSYSYLRTCENYTATVESFGFDEIRVQYRQLRRAIIREIILDNLNTVATLDLIERKISEQVPEEDRQKFSASVYEDLKNLSPARIAGLGVTKEQLAKWLKRHR